jgi:hypothetical protein
MTESPKKPARKKTPGSPAGDNARKFGYIVAIVIMIVMIYVLRHLRQWGVNFLNEDWENCLVYIQLSIYATIAANVLFIFYDNRWFKHLIQGITNIFGALSVIMIYVFFPLIIQDETWVKWIKIGLLILFGLTIIGVIVELIKGFRDLARNPEKI